MKLGFLTACLPDRSLDDIAAWAAQHGFEAVSYTHLTLPTICSV